MHWSLLRKNGGKVYKTEKYSNVRKKIEFRKKGKNASKSSRNPKTIQKLQQKQENMLLIIPFNYERNFQNNWIFLSCREFAAKDLFRTKIVFLAKRFWFFSTFQFFCSVLGQKTAKGSLFGSRILQAYLSDGLLRLLLLLLTYFFRNNIFRFCFVEISFSSSTQRSLKSSPKNFFK